jgi:hypothetical protein
MLEMRVCGKYKEWVEGWIMITYRGAQIKKKCRNHFKILGARRVTRSKSNAENPQMFSTTEQNSVIVVTWRPGFVHP